MVPKDEVAAPPVYRRNHELSQRLLALSASSASPVLSASSPSFEVVASPGAPVEPDFPVHVMVSVNEINNLHGTGPLVKRIFQGRSGIFSIRSRDHWGVQDFGDWCVTIPHQGISRAESFRRVLHVLRGRNVRGVTCVPFLPEELITSIAVKEAFDVPLCSYIMDDQNVAAHGIPDHLMAEYLEKCSLRLYTHGELRDAYQKKFGLSGYILPAIVPADVVAEGVVPNPPVSKPPKGALIGSFWDQSWFDGLCDALEPCRRQIDWFGQNWSPWLKFPPEDLARAGIVPHGVVPESTLAVELRQYPFVIVPSGALDGKDTNVAIAHLSLPGRILFAAATSQTPILMVGSENTCGSRFVKRFAIGLTVPYDSARLSQAMTYLSDPQVQARMRRNASHISRALSDRGVVDWLAHSIELGAPADRRFEDLFARSACRDDCSDSSPSTTSARS